MANILSEQRNIDAAAGRINGAISTLRGLIRDLGDAGAPFTGEVDTISTSIDTIQSEVRDAVRKTEQDN